MKVLVEFAWTLSEKVGRKYVWLDVKAEELNLQELFSRILPSILGEDLGKALNELFLNKEVFVVVNGVIAKDLAVKVKDGDKVFLQPVASGG
jgi:molybdopterin converting factor small subunit